MKRLRILLLTTSFPLRPGAVSGVFVERLAVELAKSNQVEVLTPADTGPGTVHDDRPFAVTSFRYAPARWQVLAHGPGGIPAALAGKPWTRMLLPVFLIAMLLACWRHARSHDLIFANWSINGFMAGIAGRLRGRRVITTLRGEDVNRSYTSWVYQLVLGGCVRLSHRVVAVSSSIGERLMKLYPECIEKISVIPNGVDSRFLTIERKGTTSAGARVLFLGSLTANKGVDVLLKAVAEAPPNLTLTVVGEGPEMSSLSNLAHRLGLEDRVSFLGSMPSRAIPQIMKASDALVLCSFREGRPNVVLEAMAAALPVVASDIAGVRELINDGENGLLFPAGDGSALRECLLRMLDPRLRQKLGTAGRETIVRLGLTWEKSALAYQRLFHEVLSR